MAMALTVASPAASLPQKNNAAHRDCDERR
jgi:hypothetical protein